jgi:DNA-binding LytR/AlgR family response regulator
VPKGGIAMNEENYPFILVTDEETKIQVEHFSPSEIMMISSDKKGAIHHHINGKTYRCLNLSLEDYEEIWYQYGFRLTERGNVVNLNRVVLYDEDDRALYFVENPMKTSLKAFVSRIQYEYLAKQWRGEFNIIFISMKKKQKSVQENPSTSARALLGL